MADSSPALPESCQIEIAVTPQYLAEHSDPSKNRYVFAYQVQLTNLGRVEVQLLTRYWRIYDGEQAVQEVRGEGVVGEQPVLQPASSYQYVSSVTLQAPVGAMEGSYQMRAGNDETFAVEIPRFVLSIPRTLH